MLRSGLVQLGLPVDARARAHSLEERLKRAPLPSGSTIKSAAIVVKHWRIRCKLKGSVSAMLYME